MATIDDKQTIDNIITGNGYFQDDPRVYQIVEYTNMYGNITWGVTWINESPNSLNRYLVETPYVRNPKIIWKAK